MNKFTTGLSILSTLVFAAGCAASDATVLKEAPTGEAVFALQSGAFSVAGNIVISTSPGGVARPGVAFLQTEPTLAITLPVGDYTAALPTWEFFEGVTSLGTQAGSARVTLGAFAPFTILDTITTTVNMNFTVDDVVVALTAPGTGGAGFVLVANGSCNSGAGCIAPNVCATIDAAAASCQRTCAAPALEAIDCLGTDDCVDMGPENICQPAV